MKNSHSPAYSAFFSFQLYGMITSFTIFCLLLKTIAICIMYGKLIFLIVKVYKISEGKLKADDL
jgi:hypothetical protein